MPTTGLIHRLGLLVFGLGMLAVLASCKVPPGKPLADSGARAVTGTPGRVSTVVAVATAHPAAVPTLQQEVVASATPFPPIPTPRVDNGDRDVAPLAAVTVSGGQDTARNAIDGKLDTLWSAGGGAPQSYTLALDRAYLVDAIQLVVAQTPAGQTTDEIWLGDPSGSLTLYQKLVNSWTSEGQVITIPVEPARVVSRVWVRTVASPSFVAWYEIRVFGRSPPAGTTANAPVTGAPPVVVPWPRVAIVGDFHAPTEVTNAGDGSNRLFVVERGGTISIVKDGVPRSRPFLDITDRVKCCDSEQGLFSIAFPPNYGPKRYLYVAYTSTTRGAVGDVVIARYHLSADPDLADPSSEQIILTIPKENAAHNGGHLAFGPRDGYLYFGSGDGGLQNDPTNEAQSLGSLKGKILRIDSESGVAPYAIPPTNPFAHTPGARPEIWALGLRNPWQFSFDPPTGDLYIADVGENTYEEIDFQPASSPGGANYGWHVMEGTHCYRPGTCDQRGLTLPVLEYTHQEGSCATIGGQVYRGKAYPDMQGFYFYGDLCSGRIWGLRQVGTRWESNLLVAEPFQITSIGVDEQGNLYLTDFTDGAIFRIAEPTSP